MLTPRRQDAKKAQEQEKDWKNAFLGVLASWREALLILGLLVVLPAFAAEPAAEHLSHGRFDDVTVYQPAGTATSFALFVSGDGGLDANTSRMAQALTDKGAMVAAFDWPRFAAMLNQQKSDCEYTAGDLENLSHFVQAYYKLPVYLPPVLVGYSSGAGFAYANLAQAPADVFGAGLLLGFSPQLKLRKPLCPGTSYKAAQDAGGARIAPSKTLPTPITLLQAADDHDASAAPAREFAAQLGKAEVTELAGVGHGFAVDGTMRPQYLAAYDKLAEPLKPAMPAAPADLNGLPVIEVPPKAGVPEAAVYAILFSGDGGWAGLDQEVAGALTAHGIPVIGLDSLRYFWTARTPASAAADMDRIIRYYSAHLHKQKVLLIGYSQGADVMPFIINRLPAQTRAEVALGAVMGLSEHALFEFHMGNWINANQDQGLPTAPEMEKPSDIPMLCIYGTGETDTLCPKLDPKKVQVVQLPGGHHFGGDYERLAREILNAAKMPEVAANGGAAISSAGGQTSAETEAPSGASNEIGFDMLTFHVLLTPLLSLIAGLLILMVPRLLNYIVAIYLIAVGVVGLLQHYH